MYREYKSFNFAQSRTFDVQNIHVKPQFSAQFSCDSLEINPCFRLYVIHHQNLIKIANKNAMQLSASVGAN